MISRNELLNIIYLVDINSFSCIENKVFYEILSNGVSDINSDIANNNLLDRNFVKIYSRNQLLPGDMYVSSESKVDVNLDISNDSRNYISKIIRIDFNGSIHSEEICKNIHGYSLISQNDLLTVNGVSIVFR